MPDLTPLYTALHSLDLQARQGLAQVCEEHDASEEAHRRLDGVLDAYQKGLRAIVSEFLPRQP